MIAKFSRSGKLIFLIHPGRTEIKHQSQTVWSSTFQWYEGREWTN